MAHAETVNSVSYVDDANWTIESVMRFDVGATLANVKAAANALDSIDSHGYSYRWQLLLNLNLNLDLKGPLMMVFASDWFVLSLSRTQVCNCHRHTMDKCWKQIYWTWSENRRIFYTFLKPFQ